MSTDPRTNSPTPVSPAAPLVSASQTDPTAAVPPVTPVIPVIPVSPVPPTPPSDPVSGVMLSQLGQLPVDPSAPAVGAPPIAIPSPAGKEGASMGLPAPTEIPLTALRPTAPEGTTVEGASTPASTPEVGASAGAGVEVAPTRELEPEVEATQEKIQQREINAPAETVIAAPTMPVAPPKTVAQPVVVLPLSEQGMQEGRKKSPQFSIRWLYVWCVRQIRKFSETLVVYRDK